jgi:hypothetical protein
MSDIKMQKRIICPACGYRMPYSYGTDAECRGVIIRCKNNRCKKYFELIIVSGKQKMN